jgi:hypothetical protein
MRPLSTAPRLSRSAIGLIALAMAMAGCSTHPFLGDIAEVTRAAGLQIRAGGGWDALEEGASVPDGSTLRTEALEARLRLDGAQVWLSPGATVVLDASEIGLERGEVLVDDPGGTLRTAWGDMGVAGAGTYRVAAGAAPRVGVYRGQAEVTRPGEVRTVHALREVGLAVRRLPAGAPLAYRAQDPWDRALLTGAISFDDEVDRLRRGIDRRYGTDPMPAGFYETFVAVSPAMVPTLMTASRMMTDDERFGPPSDALITLFVAQASAGDRDAALVTVVEQVTSLRRAGARWGLIAEELDITTTRLASSVDLGEERRVTLADVEAPDPAGGDGAPAGAQAAGSGTGTGSPPAPAPSGSAAGGTAPPPSGGGGSGGGGSGGGGSGGGAPSAPPLPTPAPAPIPTPAAPAPPAPAPSPGVVERTVDALVGNGKGPSQLPDQAQAGQVNARAQGRDKDKDGAKAKASGEPAKPSR